MDGLCEVLLKKVKFMAEITIIIPMYNPGRSIVRCLKSLDRQSYQDYEVIIINDGSTDNSLDILSRYLSKNDKLNSKVQVKTRENHGIAETRNYGLKLAKSKYISFMDQDDFISKDYLQNYYEAMNTGDYDVVVGGYERVSSSGKILSRRITRNHKWCMYPVIMPWAHLYKRDFLINNNIEFLDCNIGEDIYFNVLAYQLTDKVKILSDIGYKWFFNDESVSNTLHRSMDGGLDELKLYNSLYDSLKDINKENGEYIEYFFLRSICHNFLYSVRQSKKESVIREYDIIFKWLRERYPKYNKNIIFRMSCPRGENPVFYMSVVAFYTLDRIKLLKPVLRLLSK